MTVSPFDILLESFLLSIFAASKRDYKIFSFAACSSPKSKSPVLAHVLHSPLKKMTMEHLEGQSVWARLLPNGNLHLKSKFMPISFYKNLSMKKLVLPELPQP